MEENPRQYLRDLPHAPERAREDSWIDGLLDGWITPTRKFPHIQKSNNPLLICVYLRKSAVNNACGGPALPSATFSLMLRAWTQPKLRPWQSF
jgi:hypothetical protein